MDTNINKTINAGLLAYGMSGKVFHAPFLNAHDGFNLKAVVERSHKNAVNDYPNIISYNSVDELLNDEEIDLVVINTPNNLHYEHSKAALNAHKHILVEKPFTANTAQAKELFELADSVGKQIFFYQNRRWDSDFTSVKKVLDSGKLGKLVEVHLRYDRYRNVIGPKAFKEKLVEASGLLYDLGPHLLDQVISLFGKPLNFHKILGKNRAGTLVDDYFSIQLSFPDSVNIFVTSSMLVVNPQPGFILHGVNGSFIKHRTDIQEEQLLAGMKLTDPGYGVEPANKDGLLTTIDVGGNKTEEIIKSEVGSYLPLFEAVYQAITNNQPYPVTREDVLAQLEIIES
ncbi:Gfo/Idh/MocA family oxidoreductase [Pedobacter alluvionis]|uniref:Oxidoreductase n=1 Tax=Pedobacter alluvionis TaxID=475253 RepID=A0A497Y4D5_9SPHI|nr:Gfo/Idh/MocA family oxidoreductase [Pedobacter alluvionis]RLJ77761.1 putative dehydrogenase [Pedobacter alluvionis]TFB33041.1 oxidoreductase [Pedobacter alluvionis]